MPHFVSVEYHSDTKRHLSSKRSLSPPNASEHHTDNSSLLAVKAHGLAFLAQSAITFRWDHADRFACLVVLLCNHVWVILETLPGTRNIQKSSRAKSIATLSVSSSSWNIHPVSYDQSDTAGGKTPRSAAIWIDLAGMPHRLLADLMLSALSEGKYSCVSGVERFAISINLKAKKCLSA